MTNDWTGLRIYSRIDEYGTLRVSLERVDEGPPGAGELVVEIGAAPINPSDLGTLLGPVDLATLRTEGSGESTTLIGKLPAAALGSVGARLGRALPTGLEGAGTVVAAGPGGEALIGRKVAVFGIGSYAQYRKVRQADCIVLPAGTSARAGAASFVNPLTALSMVEVVRREGHRALVHTAAASNLGQMLNRVCLADGIGLVNVVRSAEQAKLLREQGAIWICDSSTPDFDEQLSDAIAATGATLAFDAIGGGTVGGRILRAMESAIARAGGDFSRYGSTTRKQLYIYGGLDRSPTIVDRSFGMAWAMGGWLLMPYIESIGEQAAAGLRERIAANLDGLFASHFDRAVTLEQALHADLIRSIAGRGTGRKALIMPGGAALTL